MVTDRLGTRRLREALLASTSLVVASMLLAAAPAHAQDATWVGSAGNDFNNGANWSTGTAPTGTAFFGASNPTILGFSSSNTTVGGWTFNAGAGNYGFTTPGGGSLVFNGAGIVVNGGGLTINAEALSFLNSSTAGSAIIFSNDVLSFRDSSSAANARIINSSNTIFSGTSTAGNADLSNNGTIAFNGASTAGNASIGNMSAGASVDFSGSIGAAGDGKLTAGSINGPGTFVLGSNELTVGSNNRSTEVSGTITGAGGSLVKVGTGTLTLSGQNTYTGSTTVNGGTLQLGTLSSFNSTIGDTVNVGTGGTLDVVRADLRNVTSVTNSGMIRFENNTGIGGAAVTNNAGGTVDFSGTSGLSGIHELTAGSIAGAGNYILGNNTLSVGGNGLSTEVSGVISGVGGALNKGGSGTLTLSGANTYTGGTFVDGGTLQIGTLASTGSVVGAIAVLNNGTLNTLNFVNADTSDITTISNAGNVFYSNSTSAGSAAITNNRNLGLRDTATAGSATIRNDNAMAFSGSSSAGNAAITNNFNTSFSGTSTAGNATFTNNGFIYFNGASNAGNASFTNNTGAYVNFSGSTGAASDGKLTAGSIAGAGTFDLGSNELTVGSNNQSTEVSGMITGGGGSLVKVGTGTLTLSGQNIYTGNTTVNGGTLQIGTLSSFGMIGNTLTIGAGGTVDVVWADLRNVTSITNSGMIKFENNSDIGNAAVTNNAGGTVDFSGTSGSQGSHQLNAGSIAGAGNYVLGNNTLSVGSNGLSTEVSGAISGVGGALFKGGSGTLTLSGANTYTDGTTVAGGTLQIGTLASTGSVVGAITVESTGTLNFVNANSNGITSISNAGSVSYTNSSSAGSAAITNDGTLDFRDTATAGDATITNNFNTSFSGTSSAANATINNGYSLRFNDASTAGSSTINNYSMLVFDGHSTAGDATINNTGNLIFTGNSTAGNAAITTNGIFAITDFRSTTGPAGDGKVSVGSIAGDGAYVVGAGVEFTMGGNNQSALLRGTLDVFDAMVKTGTGTQTLAGYYAHLGTATINGGTLQLGDASVPTLVSGSITIGSGGALSAFNADMSAVTSIANGGTTYFGTNTSAASIAITNSNTMEFRDASTAGSATIANNTTGQVNFKDSSTAGSAAIGNDGTVSFYNTSTAGSATITNNATGQVNFKDSSTADSAAIGNDGTVSFYNTSTAGSATITNNTSGSIQFYDNSSAGSATINISGSNAEVHFRDASTAGNATINVNGALFLWDSSTLGNATVTNNTRTNFENGSSAGSARITNNNTIDFYDNSTAANSTIISNDHLWFVGSASAGSATITNNSGGELMIRNDSTAGSATITNTGQFTFDGQATGGNATIANNVGGNLLFTASSTAESAGIFNNGQLTFDGNTRAGSAKIMNTGNVLFDGNSTPGNAQLINNAPGAVFDLSMTAGPNSDGRITAGSIAGNGTFYLGEKELTVGSNNLSTEVAGVIADGGSWAATGASLVKVGIGTLTLSGNNTYTGATTINGGTLAVNSDLTLSSGITVNNGGTLGGNGTVGTTTINTGGALAPGNSVGTLTVNGNLAFSTGSFYKIEVSPTSADRTNVLGTATLTGATVQAVQLPGSFRAQTYTILNATGGFGGTQFAGLTGDTFAPGARNPHLTYDLNNVYLNLDPGTLVLPQGASGNQASVAGAINRAVESGFTPPAGFDALLNMSGAKLTNALGQVSGQPGAATTQGSFSAMQQFVTMINPFSGNAGSGQGGVMSFASEALGYAAANSPDAKMRAAYAAVMPPTAPASLNERWGVWASGYGGSSTVSGNTSTGSSSTTSRIYGSVAGADYRVSPDTVVGFALGGAGFNFSVSDGLGSGRADLFQAGVYGRHAMGAAYISGTFAYGLQDVTTDRTVTVSGADKLQANFKANTFTGRVEGGYRLMPWPAFGATPYAAVQVTSFDLPSYRERAVSGSDQFALSYNAQTTTNVRTELGTRADKLFLMDNGLLTLSGRLAWAHDSNTDRPVTAAFQSLPGASFTVNGAKPAADSALVTAGAEMKWLNGFSLGGSFEGEFSSTTQSYAGKSTLRYAW